MNNWLFAPIQGGFQAIINRYFQNNFMYDLDNMKENDENFLNLN